MPFAVSKCDVTVASFDTNKISWTNRTDVNYISESGIATINKSVGSNFSMTINQVVVLANLDTDYSNANISNVKYQLKLYSGYLEYGLYHTFNDDGHADVLARLPNIHLNVIASV